MFYRNSHCKHVIFGGSDTGYAGLLGDFTNVPGVNEHITILNALHIPLQSAQSVQKFRWTSLPNIFRPEKIKTYPASGPVHAGSKRSLNDPIRTSPRRPSAPTYQARSDGLTGASSLPQVPPSHPPVQSVSAATGYLYKPRQEVYINGYGQRLDLPVEWDDAYLQHLFHNKSKLCNNFYLKGYCPFGDSCQWDHSERLNQMELDTLRHKARTSACRNPFCRDGNCTLGHMCPRDSACFISSCKFLPEMHHIDISEVYLLDTASDTKKLVRYND